MLGALKNENHSPIMLKHFILLFLLYPLVGSKINNLFSPDVIYANIFVCAFVAMSLLEGCIDWKRKSWLVLLLIAGLICFNVISLYVNISFYQWYSGQLNMSVAFLFLLSLLMMKDSSPALREDLIRFLLKAALFTNMIGLIPGFLGYNAVEIRVSGLEFIPMERMKGDTCYYWIYHHKSEYSFMLVLMLSLTTVYRRLFETKWQFWGSIAVYVAGLVLADTRITMAAAICILVGAMLDFLIEKNGGFSFKHLLWFLPIAVVGILMLYWFSRERDFSDLGGRTNIWKAAFPMILDNPWGRGPMWGILPFEVNGYPYTAWNCHNMFLNILMQFSIPAGGIFFLMFAAIVIASIWHNRSFTTLGIWAAVLVPLNMDQCMLLGQIPFVFMIFYFLFFHPLRKAK